MKDAAEWAQELADRLHATDWNVWDLRVVEHLIQQVQIDAVKAIARSPQDTE